jgi:hypothetical protein
MSPLNVSHEYRAKVVVKMPKTVDKFIIYAEAKYLTMSANSRYAVLSDYLDKLNIDAVRLKESQSGLKSKPPTVSSSVRNIDFKNAKTSIRVLALKIQGMADADPENAATIITEASFSVKKISVRPKQKCWVTDGPESGSVYIYGEGHGAHNFRISIDGINWSYMAASKGNRKLVRGLTVGNTYYFQAGPVLKDGEEGKFSKVMSIVVR